MDEALVGAGLRGQPARGDPGVAHLHEQPLGGVERVGPGRLAGLAPPAGTLAVTGDGEPEVEQSRDIVGKAIDGAHASVETKFRILLSMLFVVLFVVAYIGIDKTTVVYIPVLGEVGAAVAPAGVPAMSMPRDAAPMQAASLSGGLAGRGAPRAEQQQPLVGVLPRRGFVVQANEGCIRAAENV